MASSTDTKELQSETGATPPEGGGLPQMDPEGSLFVSQLFWLFVTFAFLYLMMSRIALPRIGNVIEARRDKIADDLDRAADYKAKTDAAIEAYELAFAEAKAKAHRIAEENRRRLAEQMETLRKETEAELEIKLGKAEARIEETKVKALANVREIATEAASAMVERLSGAPVDAPTVEKAVDGIMTPGDTAK